MMYQSGSRRFDLSTTWQLTIHLLLLLLLLPIYLLSEPSRSYSLVHKLLNCGQLHIITNYIIASFHVGYFGIYRIWALLLSLKSGLCVPLFNAPACHFPL